MREPLGSFLFKVHIYSPFREVPFKIREETVTCMIFLEGGKIQLSGGDLLKIPDMILGHWFSFHCVSHKDTIIWLVWLY